jgi:hypothetical protein
LKFDGAGTDRPVVAEMTAVGCHREDLLSEASRGGLEPRKGAIDVVVEFWRRYPMQKGQIGCEARHFLRRVSDFFRRARIGRKQLSRR